MRITYDRITHFDAAGSTVETWTASCQDFKLTAESLDQAREHVRDCLDVLHPDRYGESTLIELPHDAYPRAFETFACTHAENIACLNCFGRT